MTISISPAHPRPTPAPPRPYAFPRFERRLLSNGIRLVVAPVRKLPVVTAMAVVDAGAMTDPAGSEGLAQLAADLLTEGTARRDGATMTLDAERMGAALDSWADWDAAYVRLGVLAARLPQAFALMAEVLTQPSFDARELERMREERLAEILQLRTEPRGLADEAFNRWTYAEGSRYALPDGGTTATVKGLAREQVVAFFEARYRPAATTLVVAGDVDVDDVARMVEQALGGWRGEAPGPVAVDDRPARLEPAVLLVGKADAPQSELRVGHVGLPRRHPDFFPVTVMNAILGGLFSSRINLNLREVHAWTYGAHSGFDWRRHAGPFSADSAVKSDVTADALREMLGEIDRMRASPVTPEELSLATSYLDGVFPIRYETTSAIAGALANLELYGLPDDYFDTYRANVRAVTAADVLRAASTHLHPDRVQVVVVGDPAQVRAPLEALGAGAVTVVGADEL